jgi:hypothetical protein
MENVLVSATRLSDWQMANIAVRAEQSESFARVLEAGETWLGSEAGGHMDEVIVTGKRAPVFPTVGTDASMYAPMPDLFPRLQEYLTTRFVKDLLLIGGVALALLEPTPAGESLLLGSSVASSSRALVPYYPPASGFWGVTSNVVLTRGTLIDRFGGSKYSQFFSPIGTPMHARALPAMTATQPLRRFEVMSPLQVEAGQVAPWFGQIGLGTQYRSSATLGELLEQQILREIGP